MVHNNASSILYFLISKNVALLQILTKSPGTMNLAMLQGKLRKNIHSSAELLKSLRQGEILGLIQKNRMGHIDFTYGITPKGERALRKYLEFVQELEPHKERIVESC